MPFLGFGFDPTFLLLLPAMAFAFWAQHKVRSTYEQFAQVPAANGMTGRDMARSIMQRNGVSDVSIEQVAGALSDHYDPGAKQVRLSADIYAGQSIAAIAVAAHEVGHVLQDHEGYLPLRMRSSFAPVAGFGSTLAMPLFFIGLIFGNRMAFGGLLMDLGIIFFAAAVVFHMVTLPVEFDASRRHAAGGRGRQACARCRRAHLCGGGGDGRSAAHPTAGDPRLAALIDGAHPASDSFQPLAR